MRALAMSIRVGMRQAAGESALGPEILEFLEAVVLMVAYPIGAPARTGEPGHEQAAVKRVTELLEASLGDDRAVAEAADALATDMPVLAAFFQNLDLLPSSGYSPADAIATLVVMALSRLEEIDAEQ